tara:strand:- start:3823 stop:4524 length:702 start_codon:yes stop_codon:yes gene_type:complete
MKRPKDILTREFLEEHYINQRKSVHTIAKEQGIRASNSVQQAIGRHGLSRSSLKNSSDIITKEFLEEYYVKQNLSQKDVAIKAGFKRKSLVVNALLKYNIPVREHTLTEKWIKGAKRKKSHHTIPGRFFYSIKCSAGQRGLSFDITIDQIWELFLKQDKKCAYSGMDLRFKQTNEKQNKQTASLDRINSSIGYTIDNVQWVHKHVNVIKWDFDESYFLELCKNVVIYRGIKTC